MLACKPHTRNRGEHRHVISPDFRCVCLVINALSRVQVFALFGPAIGVIRCPIRKVYASDVC